MISPSSCVQWMPLPSSSSIVSMSTIVGDQRSDDCYLLSADKATLQLPRPCFTPRAYHYIPTPLQTNSRCLLQSRPTLRCTRARPNITAFIPTSLSTAASCLYVYSDLDLTHLYSFNMADIILMRDILHFKDQCRPSLWASLKHQYSHTPTSLSEELALEAPLKRNKSIGDLKDGLTLLGLGGSSSHSQFAGGSSHLLNINCPVVPCWPGLASLSPDVNVAKTPLHFFHLMKERKCEIRYLDYPFNLF